LPPDDIRESLCKKKELRFSGDDFRQGEEKQNGKKIKKIGRGKENKHICKRGKEAK